MRGRRARCATSWRCPASLRFERSSRASFGWGPAAFGAPAGGASEATFPRLDGPAGVPRGFAWTVQNGRLDAAVGADPRRLLGESIAPTSILGSAARAARVLSQLGEGVTFALLAEPLRLGRMGSTSPSAPVVVAGGRRAGIAWARVVVADPILTEGVRLGGGLF